MFLIGLTGGIASGKSTVAGLLASHGAETIDADQVAREVVARDSVGLASVVSEFGPEMLTGSGELNREILGKAVFSDPVKRLALENILHPLIKQRTTELIAKSKSEIVVYAVPLLVEANVDYPFDMILTVEAGEDRQAERLVSSRGMTNDEAQGRIAAQVSRAEREKRADFVLDGSGTIPELEEQIASLWPKIQQSVKEKIK